MRILVTGAGGFVGRHVVQRLLSRDHKVVGLDFSGDGILRGAEAVIGDIGSAHVRSRAVSSGIDALVHLATVPGGAAEADPSASRRINIDAMYDLMEECAAVSPGLRVVFASSIAVYGDLLPAGGVDDSTPLSPRMIYGGHKAMMETAVTMLSNRGTIDGVTVRLPGILARPKGPSGMKSAFMSDLFHALKAREPFACPVSPEATIWAESVARCADNFVHAIELDSSRLPPTRAVTLPALTITMRALAEEIARQCGTDTRRITYEPDAQLESAFGRHPALTTSTAESAGFAHDGSLANLVKSALETLE